MVQLSFFLATAVIIASASARPTKQRLRRETPNAYKYAGKANAPVVHTGIEPRHAQSTAGFCRKRAPQAASAALPQVIVETSIAQPNSSPTASAEPEPTAVLSPDEDSATTESCDPAASECLSTITIENDIKTVVIDVTSTIYVTPDAAPSETPVSKSSWAEGITTDATSASQTAETAPLSIPSTISSAAPSSEGSPITTISPNLCPAGSSWKRMTDSFATFDETKWKRESGSDGQISFGPDGMLMKLTEANPNIVFESKANWIAPVTLTAAIKTARAGGIVNCAIFGKAGIDEIDLELIEGSWQVPMWHDGKRLEKNQDVTWTLADTSNEMASWVFNDRDILPFSGIHDWTVHWDKEFLTWSADGKKLLDVERLEGGAWPDQALPFRWGPWAAPEGWAGKLDWTIAPEPVMQLKSITIEGCQID